MSFLAQLRQQQSDTQQGLRLCYVLSIEQPTQGVQLSLSLSALRNGELDKTDKPYIIQTSQLERPPPFLDISDIPLLESLVNASPDWLLYNQGNKLPQHGSAIFLQTLIETGRCYIETRPSVWLRLKSDISQAVELRWIVDEVGFQRLRWHTENTGSVFCLGTHLFVYRDGKLSHGISSLDKDAIEITKAISQSLAPKAIPSFLIEHQSNWQKLDLPLPSVLPTREVGTSMTPILRCYSLPSSVAKIAPCDFIELEFRTISQHYCVTQSVGATSKNWLYWNGTELLELERHDQQRLLHQQQLAPLLGDLESPETDDNRFLRHSSDQKAWKDLLINKRAQLESLGFEFIIEAGFRHHYVSVDNWQVQLDQSDADYSPLSLKLMVGAESVNLKDLITQLQVFNSQSADGDMILKLENGRLLLLPAEQLTSIMDVLGDWTSARNSDFRVPLNQIYRLHQLQQHLPSNVDWQGDLGQLDQAMNIHRTPAMLDSALSAVKAEMRPYQWLGVCWLQHLKQHRVCGLLADDMGLGKTLQTLAHLSLEKQQGTLDRPALVVAPTSLLHNWAVEIERFTPHLTHIIIHGNKRHQHWAQLNEYDIIISSYALIVNDLDRWKNQPLSWLILDEAQMIKNSNTRTSQALREIESDYRLCLSGTPVENHLGELWSLLDFLMPGCLGSRKQFKSNYQKPIEQKGDSDQLQQLLTRIAPFMLRRQKDQVARDLPAKTEINQIIRLDEAQQAFYERVKSAEWLELQQQLSDPDSGGQRQILLLTALLKLRQACCDPKLLNEYSVRSAKREHCIEMITELVAENRVMLVFSQFTSMLDLLAEDLQVHNISYLKLTGKTRNRAELVKNFQQGQASVFLISLKAGGVGLNLTRADTVIHYDPWWNSAAEQQATDRAHRIGQDKPVFVYKLIAENTIEEKIAQLQQRKAVLSQHVNHQAQASGKDFALKLEDLFKLWQEEPTEPC